MLFPPFLWVALVLQNQPNVCFPSKVWQNWRTVNISQEILRRLSDTACSCGGRSRITQASCCYSPLSTFSVAGLTGEMDGFDCTLHVAPLLVCGHTWMLCSRGRPILDFVDNNNLGNQNAFFRVDVNYYRSSSPITDILN